MNKIRNIKGTKDLLPNETYIWQQLEQKIHRFSQQFGYKEIRTPSFENTDLRLIKIVAKTKKNICIINLFSTIMLNFLKNKK